MRLGTAALVGAALVSVGCSASYPNTFNVREVATVPTDAPDSGPPIPHPLPGFAQRVAAGPEYVVVSTDQGPFRVVGSADAVAMGFVDSSGTSTLGPLTALVPRDPPPPANGDTLPATGLLALAPQGLLLDFTDYFEPSGLPLTAPEQASALDDVGTGDLEIVWIGVPGGVERLGKGASRTFTVSGETTAPTAVLQLSDALALVGFGGKVYELGYTRNEVTSLDHDFGAVHAMARGGAPGEAFLATADGLYARDASGTYAHLLAGKDVGGVAFDPLNGAYFTTADALLLLKADGSVDIATARRTAIEVFHAAAGAIRGTDFDSDAVYDSTEVISWELRQGQYPTGVGAVLAFIVRAEGVV